LGKYSYIFYGKIGWDFEQINLSLFLICKNKRIYRKEENSPTLKEKKVSELFNIMNNSLFTAKKSERIS